jgi:hypothetical protein
MNVPANRLLLSRTSLGVLPVTFFLTLSIVIPAKRSASRDRRAPDNASLSANGKFSALRSRIFAALRPG